MFTANEQLNFQSIIKSDPTNLGNFINFNFILTFFYVIITVRNRKKYIKKKIYEEGIKA